MHRHSSVFHVQTHDTLGEHQVRRSPACFTSWSSQLRHGEIVEFTLFARRRWVNCSSPSHTQEPVSPRAARRYPGLGWIAGWVEYCVKQVSVGKSARDFWGRKTLTLVMGRRGDDRSHVVGDRHHCHRLLMPIVLDLETTRSKSDLASLSSMGQLVVDFWCQSLFRS